MLRHELSILQKNSCRDLIPKLGDAISRIKTILIIMIIITIV